MIVGFSRGISRSTPIENGTELAVRGAKLFVDSGLRVQALKPCVV